MFVLPYELPEYLHRGSGMVIDAVSLGKPIVYSKGIGMSEFLSCGNAISASSVEEFAQGMFDVLQQPSVFQKHCVDGQRRLGRAFAQTREFLQGL